MTPVIERVGMVLERAGCSLDVHETTGPGDAARFAADTPNDARAILAVGGDGTLREVIEGLEGRSTPVVVLPAGTENVLAKHFGYRADAEAATSAILNGREVACDVGVCSHRKFILMVGVGFDAEVVHRLAARRKGHISYLSYVVPGMQTLMRYRFPEVSVSVDGTNVYTGKACVWAGVMPRYSMGTFILDRAVVDDGLLDVCIMPCASRFRVLRCAASLLLRGNLRKVGIEYHQGRKVRIEGASGDVAAVQIDGDAAGGLPVECSLAEKCIRFLLPTG